MVLARLTYNRGVDHGRGFRLAFLALLTLVALTALSAFAGAAQATVNGVTADNSSVSQAAGARTVYKVGFVAQMTLTSTSQSTGTITITFPNGTDITQIQSFDIRDGATQVGNFCSRTAIGVNPPVLTCNIFNGSTVHPTDTVTITLDEVINPAAALSNPSLSVFTSAETTPVSSPASTKYQIVGQNPITNVTVDNDTVTQAAGARTVYHVGFKTSLITGGMAGAAGSQFTITFPNGTDITQIQSFDIRDGATQVGNFCSHTAAGVNPPVLTCNIFNTAAGTVNPGDTITTTLNEVTNPTTLATNPTVTVATTSDTTPVSSPSTGNTRYQIATGHQVTTASAALSNQAPSAAGVVYTIGFTTSLTGGLAGAAGSQIKIALANGTDLTHITSFNITDTNTNQQVGNFCSHTAAGVNPPVLTCNIFNTAAGTVGPGHGVRVQINGITNPATAAPETASISTTSDLPQVGASYNIGGNPPPPTVTSISPSSGPAGGGTTVTINGANFTGSTVVFGSAAASITGNTGTQLTVISPPGSGTVDVIVTNAGGTSTPSTADRFTYISPTQPPPPPPATTPPAVSGGAPSTQTGTGTTVAGTVNPENLATTAFFQYGLDPSLRGPGASTTLYDQQTPAQQVGADTASHTVTAPLTGLIPGALYHVRLVATSAAGTTFGPDQTFTTAAAPAPPPPVLGQSQDVKPVSGKVFIRNAAGQFIPLTGATQIPSGTVVDARAGTLNITAALPGGTGGARDAAAKGKKPKPTLKTQSGNFGGAIFKLTQARSGLTNLSLVEGAFQGAPTYATCKAHKAGDASAAALSSKTLQLLHASAHGKFKTTGRYSAATVRGTNWTVADRCDGTLTHDLTDSVAVTDFVRHKTIILHAGQSYLAKPRG
jgi:IPT/TIG domain